MSVNLPGKTLRLGAMTILLSFACVASLPASTSGQEAGQPLFGVAIRNSVLEQRFSRQRHEQEAVSRFILNSNVTGTQSTVTDTCLRIVPDDRSLRFDFLNSGDVRSQTTGINRDALVDSLGNHHFEITKPFWFDGSVFLTLPGHGTIQASETPQRVVSAIGVAMPLLSPLTDRVAWDEVIRRQPEINRVAAEEVSRDVLPKIDRLTDGDFGRLGREWTAMQLKTNAAFGLTTRQWAARSTDSTVTIWAHASQSGDMRDSCVPVPEVAQFEATDEIVVFTSEQAVGTLLSQYSPAGLRLTDSQMQQLQVSSEQDDAVFSVECLKKLFAAAASMDPAAASLFTLEFSPEKPIEVRFVGGDVRVTTTFQIHPTLGASSGWMTTSFNLRGKRLPEDYWTVDIRSVDVGAATGETSNIAAGGDAASPPALMIPAEEANPDDTEVTTVQAGTVWIPIVRQAAASLAEKIPPVRVPMEFDASEFLPGTPRMRLSRIDSANGMLRVALKIVDSPGPTQK